jgi:hypothetical protein
MFIGNPENYTTTDIYLYNLSLWDQALLPVDVYLKTVQNAKL